MDRFYNFLNEKRNLYSLIIAIFIFFTLIAVLNTFTPATRIPTTNIEKTTLINNESGPFNRITYTSLHDKIYNVRQYESLTSFVINSQEEMNEKICFDKELPDCSAFIDFEKQTAFFYFPGPKPSGGYSLSITDVKEYENKLVIEIVENSPGKNCMSIQMITYPWAGVKFEKTKKKIEFRVEQKKIDCEGVLSE
ncbi:MAG: protease complex subunit PrcB family protein [Candidatus Dojkabacteria bacterium]|nr:protease complex subunit PrcB family protein [Candidatus Dojkabacteria bacterium]